MSQQRSEIQEHRFYLEEGLKVALIVFMVLGIIAVGTTLGASVGYGLVWFKGTNELVLQAVEVAMAFMLIATIKRKPYGLFVFFLTVFVVAQLGLRGIDVAREGGV